MRLLLNLLLMGFVKSWEVDDRCLRRRQLDSELFEMMGGFEENEEELDRDLQGMPEHVPSDPRYLAKNDFRFNLKLYWEQGFCWQEEWIERRWCMECDGSKRCIAGDILEIQECENTIIQEFTWIPVPDTDGGRLKVYNQNLCLERISDNHFQLKVCSANNRQILVGFDPIEPFELHPYGNTEKCLNQLHHPKPFEEVYTTSCEVASGSRTNRWQVIWAEGTYDGVEYNFDATIDPTHLRSAECTPDNPCQACEGDCDRNKDCAGFLKCYKRRKSNPFDQVPGCDGSGRNRRDYCYNPAAPPPKAMDEIPMVRPIRDCDDSNKCRECEGDCDYDTHCEGDLVCFHKSGYAPVPGCQGRDESRTDYCVDPKKM